MLEKNINKYIKEIEIKKYLAYEKIISFIKPDSKVLEIGCSNGRMTKYLFQKGCKVTGIEVLLEPAREAENFCEKIIIGNIEDKKILYKLEGEKYDVILFVDVLEHLVNPAQVLLRMKDLINKNGSIIISLPNIVFLFQRLKILFGEFNYQKEGGILDDNHLRFFTLKTAKKMIIENGYEIVSFYSIPKIFRGFKLRKIPIVNLFLPLINGYLPYLLTKYFPPLFGDSFIFNYNLPMFNMIFKIHFK